ncbi:MAG: SUF system NifU family Fe-S cluster assembly protein [Rhodanobacteraceae bacterium]|jgi:nitrogen fixation NifU-like protein|nr:SUF system NifU family Fe-S cluster assembly protein [Rhodanobacteraceae bacterium]
MTAPTPYPQIVLDHFRAPRHRGTLAACTHAADGANPLCGDALRIELRCVDGRIEALAFSGEACAIATATASMLGELVLHRDGADIGALGARFARLLESGDEDAGLGPLNALRPLQQYPARRKCALLPWATLCAALAGAPHATTEPDSA